MNDQNEIITTEQNTGVNADNLENKESAETFTKEEVQKLIAAEADRRVTQALKTQQQKYEKQLSLSKLDGIERERAEKDATIAELQEKLAAYEVEKNRSELKSVLSSRGLSAEFADLIHVSDNLEESQTRIDALDKLFKTAVAEEVKRRLAGNNPQVGTSSGEATKESFAKMSLAEKQKLYRTNPELYTKLMT